MATVSVTKCDVFGTVKDVIQVRITVEYEISPDVWENHKQVTRDMGVRGVDRLFKFIDRGTTPPSKKKTDGGKDD